LKSAKFTFILLLFFSAGVSYSQANQPDRQAGLDSLYSVWQDDVQSDSIRVEAMREYIRAVPDADSSLLLANQLLEFSTKRSFKRGICLAINAQGVSYNTKKDYPKAQEYFKKSSQIAEEIGDQELIKMTLNNTGNAYLKQSLYTESLEFFHARLITAEEKGHSEMELLVLGWIGDTHRKSGDYSKALEYYQRRLKLAEEIGDQKEIVKSLNRIGWNYRNSPQSVKYFQKSLKISEEISDQKLVNESLYAIGHYYYRTGDYVQALHYFQRNMKVVEETGNKGRMADLVSFIGLIYNKTDNTPKALEYHQKHLQIAEEIGDQVRMSIALSNIGSAYSSMGNYSKAMEFFQKGLQLTQKLNRKTGIAYALDNMGLEYQKQGDYSKALDYYKRSLNIRIEVGEKGDISNSHIMFGDLYNLMGLHSKAVEACKQALILAERIQTEKNSCACLYEAYKALGNGIQALEYHERMLVLDDSLKIGETSKKLQQMEFAQKMLADSLTQVEKDLRVQMAHEAESRKKDRTRNVLAGSGFLLLLLAGGLYSRWRHVRKSRAEISKEKDRSENLLLNILPAEIAEELKANGEAAARDFEHVSILFTDFKEFTQLSEKLGAKELVAEINYCFRAFDSICEKYTIEKIKTIGDSYMAAGGLPVPAEDSARNTVLAGLEMAAVIQERRREREAGGQQAFEMRVGINTGPVVAGIVGVKKFQYDIWGDTVNTASRMESHGEIGKVNISQHTYDLLKADSMFNFTARGKIEVKGKGEVKMYFVELG
jgi:adenylate cyclase